MVAADAEFARESCRRDALEDSAQHHDDAGAVHVDAGQDGAGEQMKTGPALLATMDENGGAVPPMDVATVESVAVGALHSAGMEGGEKEVMTRLLVEQVGDWEVHAGYIGRPRHPTSPKTRHEPHRHGFR